MTMTTQFIIRLCIAGILGGLIGLEREFRSKEAGFRTHFLVALGSALFMLISQYGFATLMDGGRFDASRVAAQVVSGIGFIGAGIIIFQKNSVRGLTTAAGLWVTSAIGMACGGGMYIISCFATLLVLLVLEITHNLPVFGEKSVALTFSADSREAFLRIADALKEKKVRVWSYSITQEKDNTLTVNLDIKIRQGNYLEAITDMLQSSPDVRLISIVS